MKKLITTLLTAAALSSLLGSTAVAAEKTDKKEKDKSELSTADKEFLTTAEQINLAEISMGEMAKDKGASDDVKKFGDKLVDDHKTVSKDLKSLAESKGVTLPSEPSAEQKAKAEKLNAMEGEKFDAAFMEEQKTGHKKAIALYNKAAKSKDGEIKAFAEKTLPALHEHHKLSMGDSGKKNADMKEKDAAGKKADKGDTAQ